MADQLSYALITPSALRKGRAGGILGRLISRSGLELRTGRIFALTSGTLSALADTLSGQSKTAAYLKALTPGAHALVVVLKGEEAASKVASIIGNDASMGGRGETLRDTFGDLVEEGGKTIYFEPGVIAPGNAAEAAAGLKTLADASECTPEEKLAPGTQPCVALIYQGPGAVAKIREALGSTNPANAAHGTIRKEFGTTIMINGAHASDSVENVARETGIIRLEENDFKAKVA